MAYGDSAQASLDAVQDAIAKCLCNQRYRIADRQFQKAPLHVLRQMEKELKGEVGVANNTNPRVTRANFSGLF